MFPLSAWLPDSYPTAPAPVTAVFAGLLTKVGVYAIIRTQTLLFPDSPLTDLLLWAALATMVVGILGAVAQSDIKRMLSFTLVSHIGYMVFGIALAQRGRLRRRDLLRRPPHHHPDHAVPGRRADRTARRHHVADRLGGLAALSPVLGVLFFVPGHEPRRASRRCPGSSARSACSRPASQDGGALAYVLVAGRRADQPADPVRGGEGVEPGVLADTRGSTRAGPRARRPRSRLVGTGCGQASRPRPPRVQHL